MLIGYLFLTLFATFCELVHIYIRNFAPHLKNFIFFPKSYTAARDYREDNTEHHSSAGRGQIKKFSRVISALGGCFSVRWLLHLKAISYFWNWIHKYIPTFSADQRWKLEAQVICCEFRLQRARI